MIYGGGRFIDLVMAGGYLAVGCAMVISSIGLLWFSYRIYKREGLTDRALYHAGIGMMSAGIASGVAFATAFFVGYAHQDWQLLNLATQSGTGMVGCLTTAFTLTGIALLWAPFARKLFVLGPRAFNICIMAVAVMWSAGIAIAHSNHADIRWIASKTYELNVAIQPASWTNHNKAKYFAGGVKRAE